MMGEALRKCMDEAIWVAKVLFDRNKVTGSSANMSFKHDERIYITRSGSCFGNLVPEDFSVMRLSGEHLGGGKPSKEYPLHLAIYESKKDVGCVIHTHSFYSVLWSCVSHEDETDVVPKYTPYLEMKIGKIGLVRYAPPGTEKLFQMFRSAVERSEGYLLQNHGPVVGGTTVLEAFYALEELEESAKIAWHVAMAEEKLDIAGIEPTE